MRIGFDVAQTCVERAGCGWYADSLARAIAQVMTAEDELILYHHFDDWLNPSTDAGTCIESARVTMPLRRLSVREAAAVWAQPLHPRLGHPDIIHSNSFRAPRVNGARLIFTVYDVSFWTLPEFTTDENRIICQAGTLRALSAVDGLVFISQSARDEFERVLPGWIEEHGVRDAVIYPAARTSVSGDAALEFPLADLKPDEQFWLAVGTIQPRKNYETLLACLHRYREKSRRPVPIIFAGGDGWMSESLKEEFARLEREGAVRWLGYVGERELDSLYRRARGLLFPSWYEGFGLPVLEALGRGCPVISSDRTSLREVGGDAAQYIDPARPDSIADAMLALEEEADLTPLREAGRRQAQKFSWERAARETLEFYARVVLTNRVRA